MIIPPSDGQPQDGKLCTSSENLAKWWAKKLETRLLSQVPWLGRNISREFAKNMYNNRTPAVASCNP